MASTIREKCGDTQSALLSRPRGTGVRLRLWAPLPQSLTATCTGTSRPKAAAGSRTLCARAKRWAGRQRKGNGVRCPYKSVPGTFRKPTRNARLAFPGAEVTGPYPGEGEAEISSPTLAHCYTLKKVRFLVPQEEDMKLAILPAECIKDNLRMSQFGALPTFRRAGSREKEKHRGVKSQMTLFFRDN